MKFRSGILTVLMLWMGLPVQANFSLYGDQQLTVDSYHVLGNLYGQSQADIILNGGVNQLNTEDYSTVNLVGGQSDFLTTYDSSTANVSSGTVYSLFPQNTSTVNISGGYVTNFGATDSSITNISGGRVDTLSIDYLSAVNVAGGTVDVSVANELRPAGAERVAISAGEVNTLKASVRLEGSEQITINEAPTIASLATYGVTISGGTVNAMAWNWLSVRDSTVANISGGGVDSIMANQFGTVNLTGGTLHNLYACDSSTTIFNGHDFTFGEGLALDPNNKRVSGTGVMRGKWLDGTSWAVNIGINDPTATILAIPEPASMLILAIGGIAFLRRKTTPFNLQNRPE